MGPSDPRCSSSRKVSRDFSCALSFHLPSRNNKGYLCLPPKSYFSTMSAFVWPRYRIPFTTAQYTKLWSVSQVHICICIYLGRCNRYRMHFHELDKTPESFQLAHTHGRWWTDGRVAGPLKCGHRYQTCASLQSGSLDSTPLCKNRHETVTCWCALLTQSTIQSINPIKPFTHKVPARGRVKDSVKLFRLYVTEAVNWKHGGFASGRFVMSTDNCSLEFTTGFFQIRSSRRLQSRTDRNLWYPFSLPW